MGEGVSVAVTICTKAVGSAVAVGAIVGCGVGVDTGGTFVCCNVRNRAASVFVPVQAVINAAASNPISSFVLMCLALQKFVHLLRAKIPSSPSFTGSAAG